MEVALEREYDTIQESPSQIKVYNRYQDYGFIEASILSTCWGYFTIADIENGYPKLPSMICPLQAIDPCQWINILTDTKRKTRVFTSIEQHIKLLPLEIQSHINV